MQNQMMQKSWLAALTLAIKSFFRLFTNTMSVANDGVAMAEKAVKTARKRQAIDLGINMTHYAKQARDNAALQSVKSELEIEAFCNGDERRIAMIKQSRAQLDEIIKKELDLLEAEDAED